MAGLQRSAQTFRRSGSSGLVWDDRFFSGELNEKKKKEGEGLEFGELRHSQSVGSIGAMERRGRSTGMRAAHVPPPMDPPSPEASGCILCGIFGRRKPSKPPRRR